MNSCSQCGSPIPVGQSVCSMCYGDIEFGKDGYYRQWAEEQERRNTEAQQEHLQDHPDYLIAMDALHNTETTPDDLPF